MNLFDSLLLTCHTEPPHFEAGYQLGLGVKRFPNSVAGWLGPIPAHTGHKNDPGEIPVNTGLTQRLSTTVTVTPMDSFYSYARLWTVGGARVPGERAHSTKREPRTLW